MFHTGQIRTTTEVLLRCSRADMMTSKAKQYLYGVGVIECGWQMVPDHFCSNAEIGRCIMNWPLNGRLTSSFSQEYVC